MPDIAIRPATPDDAAALAALRFEFRASLRSTRESESAFVARCADWMRERLSLGRGEARGAWKCWLAQADHEAVGHLWIQTVEKIPNPGFELELHAYLTNFYVRDTVRGTGVGTRMLGAALEWCDGHGVDVVFLWPTARSRPLYERHGFVAADAVLTRQLTQHRKPS
jgi:GNAT superfamily N-acetyltransferase